MPKNLIKVGKSDSLGIVKINKKFHFHFFQTFGTLYVTLSISVQYIYASHIWFDLKREGKCFIEMGK